ncbi:MAG: contact-dependent growth inhibition system immunity protein [Pseudomonadota bacterium]
MSWDLSFFAAESPPPPVKELPSDWEGARFGTLAEVRKQISEVLPETDWTDLSWGRYEGFGFSYEFNIGSEDNSFGFMVHVRGGGDAASLLLRLASQYDWYVLDTAQGEWLHHCTEEDAGWKGFHSFRDSALRADDVEELRQFLSAYFHEDFEVENGSWEDAVAKFRGTESPATVEVVSRQLGELLERDVPDSELRGVLFDLGCYLDPVGLETTARSWLGQVRNLLDSG